MGKGCGATIQARKIEFRSRTASRDLFQERRHLFACMFVANTQKSSQVNSGVV
jgi:hypothetical protein